MADKKRIFISFAIEDKWAKEHMGGQALNPKTPFEFVNMAVDEPWSSDWREKCRIRIKGCDGMIVMVSKNTAKATGALWEVQCAKEENIPVLGIYCTTDDRPSSLSAELSGIKVITWAWDSIAAFIDGL